MNIWFKYAVTALLVVFVSEIAKHSDCLGSLISSLPIMTLLVIFWLFIEKQGKEKIANHAYFTFWYVLGSLPFFLIFPYLLHRYSFSIAIIASLVISLFFFYFYSLLLECFGIKLLSF